MVSKSGALSLVQISNDSFLDDFRGLAALEPESLLLLGSLFRSENRFVHQNEENIAAWLAETGEPMDNLRSFVRWLDYVLVRFESIGADAGEVRSQIRELSGAAKVETSADSENALVGILTPDLSATIRREDEDARHGGLPVLTEISVVPDLRAVLDAERRIARYTPVGIVKFTTMLLESDRHPPSSTAFQIDKASLEKIITAFQDLKSNFDTLERHASIISDYELSAGEE